VGCVLGNEVLETGDSKFYNLESVKLLLSRCSRSINGVEAMRPTKLPSSILFLASTARARCGDAPRRSIQSLKNGIQNFGREFKREFFSGKKDEVPGLVETSLFDPNRWRSLSQHEVEFAAKYALWLTLNDWVSFFSSSRGKDGEANTRSEDENIKTGEGVPGAPLVDPARLHALVSRVASKATSLSQDEDLRTRLIALGESSELRIRVILLGSQGLSLARDCLDEFLKGYEVRRRVDVFKGFFSRTICASVTHNNHSTFFCAGGER